MYYKCITINVNVYIMQRGCIFIANDTLKSINDSAEIDTKCLYNLLKLASGYIVVCNLIRIIPGTYTVRLCYFVNKILKLIKSFKSYYILKI